MSKAMLRELPELIENQVITEETAAHIRAYYQHKADPGPGRLVMVFTILGSLLVGCGIILIVAHNWDTFPKPIKLFLAFLPLLLAQLAAGFTLWKMPNNTAWREGSATLLVLTVGACISLIAQIYHFPDDLGPFLLTWSLLTLPIVYLLRSSMASMLYLVGITWYACETGYWHFPTQESFTYWGLLAAVCPWYLHLIRTQPGGNFTAFHHWLVPISVTICLALLAKEASLWMMPAYFAWFGVMGWIGQQDTFQGKRLISNGFQAFGSIGNIILLLILTFKGFWDEVDTFAWTEGAWWFSPEFLAFLLLTAVATFLLIRTPKPKPLWTLPPTLWVFLVFPFLFILAIWDEFLPQVLTNVMVLAIGIGLTVSGNRARNIGLLNFGMLVITALIICRYFDTQIPFVVRGIVFILVGLGFFFFNTRLLKNKKEVPQA